MICPHLSEELEDNMVCGFLRLGLAREGELRGLDVKLQVLGRDIGCGDGEVDEVLCRVAVAGALRPED